MSRTYEVLYGRARDGRKVSASIDQFLWSLLVIREGSEASAREFARRVFRNNACRRPSVVLRHCVIKRIADPKLLRSYFGDEAAGG